jgi:hypothetical protein
MAGDPSPQGPAMKSLDPATARMAVSSLRQESELDMGTVEEPTRSRLTASRPRSARPPPGPARPPAPALEEVHGPLYPTERRHHYPTDPPARYELPNSGPAAHRHDQAGVAGEGRAAVPRAGC